MRKISLNKSGSIGLFAALALSLVAGTARAAEVKGKAPVMVVAETVITATAAKESPWIMSARGPGQKRLGLGVGVAFSGPLPKIDFRLAYGLTSRIAIEAAIATLGFEQAARAGAQFRVHQTERFSLALRASAFEAHRFAQNEPSALLLGAGPGVAFSFAAGPLQVTSSFDVAVALLDTGAINGAGPVAQLRPAIGLEVPLDEGLSFFAETGGILVVGAELSLSAPFVASGLAW